jgi:hypothetical protein
MTRCGRVEAVFGTELNAAAVSNRRAGKHDADDGSFAGRIAITPTGHTSSFRVLFDLNTAIDPRAKITYQRIIPNDSEIFHIIAESTLEDLLNILEGKDKTVPKRWLSDRDEAKRDEAGRPLLSVSHHKAAQF